MAATGPYESPYGLGARGWVVLSPAAGSAMSDGTAVALPRYSASWPLFGENGRWQERMEDGRREWKCVASLRWFCMGMGAWVGLSSGWHEGLAPHSDCHTRL